MLTRFASEAPEEENRVLGEHERGSNHQADRREVDARQRWPLSNASDNVWPQIATGWHIRYRPKARADKAPNGIMLLVVHGVIRKR